MNKSGLFLFVVLGAIFWFNAAMIIRFFGATVFTEGNPMLMIFFALAIPLTLLSMYITKLISSVPFDELLNPVVIMTFTATFLDGITLAWFRQLYNHSFEVALHGAAWILWGTGLGLLFAYYFNHAGINKRKQKSEETTANGNQAGVTVAGATQHEV